MRISIALSLPELALGGGAEEVLRVSEKLVLLSLWISKFAYGFMRLIFLICSIEGSVLNNTSLSNSFSHETRDFFDVS